MRLKRAHRGPKVPRSPGWYPDGSGLLRYFDGMQWTERVRDTPLYDDIPEFLGLPPYLPRATVREQKRRRRLRRSVGLIAIFVIVATAVSQVGSIWAPRASTPTGFVPLITDSTFSQAATNVCTNSLSKANDSLALTGATLNPQGTGYRLLADPFTGLSQKTLKRAISHNQSLLHDVRDAATRFGQLPSYPGNEQAISQFVSDWSVAAHDLSTYNYDLSTHSSDTRHDYTKIERDLEWLNVFSTANQLTSCGVFSTQLFS